MSLRDKPLPTVEYESPDQFRPEHGASYVFGARAEERTLHQEHWKAHASSLRFIQLDECDRDSVTNITSGEQTISLRSRSQVLSLLEPARATRLYLDITGLSNHIWPALLRVAVEENIPTEVVYVEPRDYTYSTNPRENVIFDLSERIMGIAPIAQFTNLAEPAEDQIRLIPLLGFEGARFAHLIEEIQPPGDNIDPIIGVPGFRAEYPFFAFQGNQIPLRSSRSYRNARFVKANCPFSLYYALGEIRETYGDEQFLKIGLVGTKPHALGAVLFALASPDRVELVYDHTNRRPQRSTGHSHFLVYPVTEFMSGMIA